MRREPPNEVDLAAFLSTLAARPRLRGWQHVSAVAPAAIVGGAVLAGARGRPARWAAAAWGGGMTAMFSASAAYHRLGTTWSRARLLRRLDHAAIYTAVAGTGTPVALAVLPARQAAWTVGAMWTAAGVCALAKLTVAERLGRWANLSYMVLGWTGATMVVPAASVLGSSAALRLALGGLAYTVGAIVFASQRPVVHPDWYGHHELWHTATLIGAVLHATVVAQAVGHLSGRPALAR